MANQERKTNGLHSVRVLNAPVGVNTFWVEIRLGSKLDKTTIVYEGSKDSCKRLASLYEELGYEYIKA